MMGLQWGIGDSMLSIYSTAIPLQCGIPTPTLSFENMCSQWYLPSICTSNIRLREKLNQVPTPGDA